jgi:hypothetical protein
MKIAGVVGAAFVLVCQITVADVFFDIESNRYDFASWRGTTSRPYNRIVNGWKIPDFYFATNGLSASCESYGSIQAPNCSLEWNGAPVLLINAVVATNVVSAQEKVLSFFTKMATAPAFERVPTAGIGDVYYEYPGTNSWCGAVFSRNNISVWVSSFTNSLSARAISRQIDADILRRSTEAGQ